MEGDNVNKSEINAHNGAQVIVVNDNATAYVTQNNSNERNNSKQKIESRTQEYADKWNENMFLNDFDKRDRNAGVNVKLRDVYLKEHLPHYIWGNYKDERHDLKDLLSEYINEKSKNKMLLILGQPGIGKSTLITWITANFTESIDNILVYQFASDLKNIEWQNSSDKYYLVDDILTKLNLSYDDLKGRTLIIDGLDEISVGNRTEILCKLYWDLIKNNLLNNFSLIITCRENYIERLYQVESNYITLLPWNEKQIKSFCIVYGKKIKVKISHNTIETLIKNKSILGIPLILYMVLGLNISIENGGCIVDVYDKIFSLDDGGIYARCLQNKRYGAPHRISDIKNQIHQISREIALWMFENNPDGACISQEEYRKICVSVMQKNKRNEAIQDDILIGNYFKLVRHCEWLDTEELLFVHRSIYEYFVAETIFEAMIITLDRFKKKKLAFYLGNLLKGNSLSIKILEFLKVKILKSTLYNKFYLVYDTFQLMIRKGMTYYTDECFKNVIGCEMNVLINMLEIMHLWVDEDLIFDNKICNYLKYSYRDICLNLKNIELREANLDGIDLAGVNLENAKIIGGYFRGAFLVAANLKSAKLVSIDCRKIILREVNLSEGKLVGLYLNEADLKDAILIQTKVKRTELSGADLRNAKLRNAVFQESYLCKVDFRGADLAEIDLTGTNIEGSIWLRSDIRKLLPQLKGAKFTYIIEENQEERRKIYRNKLFPGEK